MVKAPSMGEVRANATARRKSAMAQRVESVRHAEPTLAQKIAAEDRAEARRLKSTTKADLVKRLDIAEARIAQLESSSQRREEYIEHMNANYWSEVRERRKLTEDVTAIASSLARCGEGEAVISKMLFGALRFHGTPSIMVASDEGNAPLKQSDGN